MVLICVHTPQVLGFLFQKNTELKAQIKIYKYGAFFCTVLSIITAMGCPGGCMLSIATKLLCSAQQQKDTLYIIQLACSLIHTASVTSLHVLINK